MFFESEMQLYPAAKYKDQIHISYWQTPKCCSYDWVKQNPKLNLYIPSTELWCVNDSTHTDIIITKTHIALFWIHKDVLRGDNRRWQTQQNNKWKANKRIKRDILVTESKERKLEKLYGSYPRQEELCFEVLLKWWSGESLMLKV